MAAVHGEGPANALTWQVASAFPQLCALATGETGMVVAAGRQRPSP